ncbi:MAG: ATP-binding protein [Sphingobacteriia bacterium]|nr:ATP-binding protein [Sphingobacteriia bacterium]NCC37838.1 ATP-binding protein [Gammaproteobacteria bacterium]
MSGNDTHDKYFRGRERELAQLLDDLSEPSGILMLWGAPGIGKSALLAWLIQILRQEDTSDAAHTLAQPPGERPQVTPIVYFITREQPGNRAERVLASLNQDLESLFPTGLPTQGAASELALNLAWRLAAVASRLAPDQRILLCVDALDEAADTPELLDLLPKTLPPGILGLYAARPHPLVQERLADRIDRTLRRTRWLDALATSAMCELLADRLDDSILHPDDRAALLARAAGNPRYLELACAALATGTTTRDAVLRLPHALREHYEIAWKPIGRAPGAHDLLCVLAVAGEALDDEIMIDLLECRRAELEGRLLPVCIELLLAQPLESRRDPAPTIRPAYRLFHASLGDYLSERFPEDLERYSERFADWCLNWRDYTGARRDYALRHGARHLDDSVRRARTRADLAIAAQRLEQLCALVEDPSWREALARLAGGTETLRQALRIAQRRLLEARPDGSGLARFVAQARLLQEENDRLYARGLAALDALAHDATTQDLERVTDLARIGADPAERVLLVLRALWSLRSSPGPLPAHVHESVSGWLDEADDPTLRALWRETLAREDLV